MCRQWQPCPLHTSQQWFLTFQADQSSSRGIPGRTSPHSRPLCRIHTDSSTLLPGSVLPTPCFNTQPLPALADSHPRQGCPGLIPKEALGCVALRPPESMQVGGDPSLRGRRAHSNRSPFQCPQRLKNPEGGERACNGSSAPSTPLNNDALFLWCPGLFPQSFPVVELLTPVPSGCLFTANWSPLPGSTLQTPLSSTQPPFTTGNLQLSQECSELWGTPYVQFLLCPAFHTPSTVFSFDLPEGPFRSQLISPP